MVHLHLVSSHGRTEIPEALATQVSSSCLVPAFPGSVMFFAVSITGVVRHIVQYVLEEHMASLEVGTMGDSCVSHQKGVTHPVCCAPSTSMNQPQRWGSLCSGWGGFVSWASGLWQCLHACPWLQGRSVKDSTLRRAQRRSFTPASFLEEDTVDFPDELDTSFFARVRDRPGMGLPRGRAGLWFWQDWVMQRAALLSARAAVSNGMLASSDGTAVCLPRKESFMRSSLLTRMKCLSHHQKLQSKTLR